MKRMIPVTLLTTLFLGAPVLAGDMSGMKGMSMDDHPAKEQAMPAHKATGTVKAIDSAKGTITIAHGAVPSANWPAMTMTFKIAPEMVGDIKEGARVEFEFVTKGMDAKITKIAAVK